MSRLVVRPSPSSTRKVPSAIQSVVWTTNPRTFSTGPPAHSRISPLRRDRRDIKLLQKRLEGRTLQRAVEDDAHRAVLAMSADQDHGLGEMRIGEGRHGDEHLAGQPVGLPVGKVEGANPGGIGARRLPAGFRSPGGRGSRTCVHSRLSGLSGPARKNDLARQVAEVTVPTLEARTWAAPQPKEQMHDQGRRHDTERLSDRSDARWARSDGNGRDLQG